MNQGFSTRHIVVMALAVVAFATAYRLLMGSETEAPDAGVGPDTPSLPYQIVAARPHDPTAYTQGLLFIDGALYEGTGIRGRSTVRRVDRETGRVRTVHRLPPHLFGEGIAARGDELVQLTWQARLGFVYDRATLKPLRTIRYESEGWGLTFDGRHFILSDGSARLRFHDPASFAVVRELTVHDGGKPVTDLNELEFARGAIYANVWKTDRIVKISPVTGAVEGVIDLAPLIASMRLTGSRSEANGIAYDRERDRFFVTGKLWPKLFEIALVE